MNSPLRTVLLILAVMLMGWPATYGQKTATLKVSQRLDQVLRWLPTDCETLVVLNGPLKTPRKAPQAPEFLVSAQLFFFFGIANLLPEGLLPKQPHGPKVVMAVDASRRFTAPKGLGMMEFEDCQILFFNASAHDAVETALKTWIEKSPKTIQIGDTKVAVFAEKGQNDQRPLLVARAQRGVLLCANNRKFLQQVLARMKRKNPDRAFPDSLPEWRHVDMEAPMWGMRHYRKGFADRDPSSPLGPQAGANVADPKAVGLVFSLEAKPEIAKVRYLSGAKDAVRIVRRGWNNPGEKLTPKIHEMKPGVIEITTPTQGRTGTVFLLVLMGYLGHGIYM
ncbi:MAG TPA: hypothetical protein ENK43_12120 [Planctomycetes bacterium]|nr:hypothetical protein [Planctomycetota bacterium]